MHACSAINQSINQSMPSIAYLTRTKVGGDDAIGILDLEVVLAVGLRYQPYLHSSSRNRGPRIRNRGGRRSDIRRSGIAVDVPALSFIKDLIRGVMNMHIIVNFVVCMYTEI